MSLKDRAEGELVSIHSLLCPLSFFERYTLYEKLERLCNFEECGHHFFWEELLMQLHEGRVAAPTARPEKK